MTTDHANLVLLLLNYPPTLIFVVAYGLSQPWWQSWWGRALLVSNLSLSALLGVNLIFRLTDWEFLARDGWLRVAVYGFISLGTWLTLGAFAYTFRHWKRTR